MATSGDDSSTVEAVGPDETVGPGPFLRVVKGDPTREELAALVTVLASLGRPTTSAPRHIREWNAPWRLHRLPQAHGPGRWRSSGLPR